MGDENQDAAAAARPPITPRVNANSQCRRKACRYPTNPPLEFASPSVAWSFVGREERTDCNLGEVEIAKADAVELGVASIETSFGRSSWSFIGSACCPPGGMEQKESKQPSIFVRSDAAKESHPQGAAFWSWDKDLAEKPQFAPEQ